MAPPLRRDDPQPDPVDTVPVANPSPSPSGNPLASKPVTTPIAVGSTSGNAPAHSDPTVAPKEFVTWVNTVLTGRLGQTKYSLIPAKDKTALINKLWQDPSVQSFYNNNYANFNSADPQVALSAAAGMGNLINQVMSGQGNDPTVAIDYSNMLQAAGVQLTVAEQAALSSATQSVNAPVPRPFNTSVISGYKFGDPMPPGGWSSKYPGISFGWDKHYGNDYGTKAGDRIVSPFAGTATVETGVEGYGNIVYVTLDNGWKMGFGHVASSALKTGDRVNPGDLIATAGQNVGDSVGSVTIVTWQDPQGKFHDPGDVLNPIFNGATFSSLSQAVPNEIGPGAAGTGMPTVNKVLDTEYPSIKSDWQTYFGSPPSPEDVYQVLQHGSSPAQWSDYIRALPSHIDGLTQGQYYDMRGVADQVSTKVLGHPSTDGIVAELAGQQLTTPAAVSNWYNEHGVTGIDQPTYNEIYKAVEPIVKGVYNDTGADPRIIKQIHDSARGHPGPQEA